MSKTERKLLIARVVLTMVFYAVLSIAVALATSSPIPDAWTVRSLALNALSVCIAVLLTWRRAKRP